MHQRRRIVLLFGLGIVLPSLLLGYFAFRGIQNDRALVEKGRLEEARRSADQVIHAVEDEIAAVETALAKVGADLSGSLSPDTRLALEMLAAENPLIEEVFCVQNRDEIHLTHARLLYVPDGRREPGLSPIADPGRSAEFQTAQRLEFQDKDYPRALAAYRRALGRANDPRLAGLILNAVARVQKKAGHPGEAVSTYERIIQDHGQIVIPGGMPLGPSAALEIAALSRELEGDTRSLQASIRLYRALLRREWILEKAEFDLFIERVRSHIKGLSSSAPPGPDPAVLQTEFRALQVEEAALRKRTERMLVFRDTASPALEAKAKAAAGADVSAPLFSRLPLDVGSESYLVSLENPAMRAGNGQDTTWGIIVDAERLREDILRPALRDRFPPGEMSWVVSSRDGATLLSSENPVEGPPTFRTNFASDFPDWTLEFHQTPPRLIKTFLLSRRGLYFFVFLLIAGILVFGLVLTLRSVSHELELARMKSDFVSTVSHEFKSPLTSIRQLAEMLQSGRVPSDERRQKYYDVLLEQSERLTLLTDNILSLAKIEEGRAEFAFEATDIAALLTEVVTSIQERVRHEGFEIGLDIEKTLPRVAADRTAFSQAVTNLVDNAIKYSGDSRRISVSARVEGQGVAIAVRDFGIGIKQKDLVRVFDRFYRGGDELTRTVKGSGLGLTLVRGIVEAHRGKIEIQSEPGRGSVFTVRLPLPQVVREV